MGHILNCLDRQQMQLWSLIDAQHELRSVCCQQEEASTDDMVSAGELIDQYESSVWQALATQVQLQRLFMEMQKIPNVKKEYESFPATLHDEQNQEVLDEPDNNNKTVDDVYQIDERKIGRAQSSSTSKKSKRFACFMCNYKSRWKGSLKMHMRVHTGEKPFVCDECGEAFSKKCNLIRHIATWHSTNPANGKKKPVPCAECGKRFASKRSLLKHKKCHGTVLPNMLDKRKVAQSSSTSPNEKRFACSECRYTTKRKQDFKVHLRVHTGEKPYVCADCDKAFAKKSNAIKHIRDHHSANPADKRTVIYACAECDERFSTIKLLHAHNKCHEADTLNLSTQSEGIQWFTCSTCGYKTKRKNALQNHLRMHTGERPFVCGECGEAYTWKSSLSTHIRAQHGKKEPATSGKEKLIACEECGKRFATNRSLYAHKKCHEADLQNLVDDGNGASTQSSSISKKSKRFACSMCDYVCGRNSHLKAHMRVHTGEKPFVCDECGKAFAKNCNLIRHIKDRHSTNPADGKKKFVSCEECGKRFGTLAALLTHKKVHQSNSSGPDAIDPLESVDDQKDNLSIDFEFHDIASVVENDVGS